MGSNVAAMLILAVLLGVITVMARSIIVSNQVMEFAAQQAVDRAGARARTNFKFESIASFGTSSTVKLKNTGATPASDYTHMDFIVTYVSGGSTVSKRLTYTESALLADQWKKTSISPDDLEAGTWNPNEILTLDARLSSSPDAETTATFALGTPNGVVGTESVVVAAPINDTLEFDTSDGLTPNIIPISGDVYAIAYSGFDDDGFLKTVQIASSGAIRDEELDTLEFDTSTGLTPNIVPVSGNVYAIAYRGDGDKGNLKTVTIATDGQITDAVIDTLEFESSKAWNPNIIPISGNVYAIAYRGDSDNGLVTTVTIATDGQITDTVIDTLAFETGKGLQPNIIPVSGNVYAIAFKGDNDDGFVTTVNIASDGQITNTVIDTFEFATQKGEEPNLIAISGNVYAIAYMGQNNDGFVTTVTIATNVQITDTLIDTLEFDAETGRTPNIIQIAGDVYAIAYEGSTTDGFLTTVTIATDGQITDTVIDTEEFDTSNGETPNIVAVSGVYAIAYEGPDEDGFLQTLEITTDGLIP